MIYKNKKIIGKNKISLLIICWLNTPTHSYINRNWDAKDIVSFINAFSDPQGARTFK